MKFLKNNIQKIFIGVIIIIVLGVVLLRGDSLKELIDTMQGATPIPIILAVLTQLAKYFAQSFAYSFSFKAVGEKMRARETLPLVFGTFFTNSTPSRFTAAKTSTRLLKMWSIWHKTPMKPVGSPQRTAKTATGCAKT